MNDIALNRAALSPIAPGKAHALNTARFPQAARWVIKLLEKFEHGTLDLTFPDGQRARFGHGQPSADIRLHNWNVIGAALKSGDIGFAETYFSGDWSTSDIARVLVFFIRNRRAAENVIYGNFWGALAYRVKHLLNRNTRSKSKKNITAHYDLGNSFYALWLDPSMTYSSALFADAALDPHTPVDFGTLRAGQDAKYARVLDELQLRASADILEIGCGWGGFAEAAGRAGHRVAGLTLSPSQLEYAQLRLQRAGVPSHLQLRDYRDETSRYDAIASIEMFEAVGEAYWPSYFAALRRCLKPAGRACIQTITIDNALFERYRRSTDFIQQYIFPGGMLPSPQVFEQQANKAGLRVVNRYAFGKDYAVTLATWRARFVEQANEVRALGFDARFQRLWEFYLAYCEAAFAEGNTDVMQYTLMRDADA